jgi:methylglutaconyl-CoA hydratase
MLNRLNLGLKKSFVSLNNKSIRYLSTTSSDIIVDKPSDGIVHLSLNRDKGKNSFSKQFLKDFTDIVAELHNDESIRVLILKSTINKVFCAGADLKERASMPEDQVSLYLSYYIHNY